MFKHILLPTDGSRHAEQAVLYGVELARVTGARVTGFYAAPNFHIFSYRAAELEESSKQFAIDVQAHAERYLAFIVSVANEVGWGWLLRRRFAVVVGRCARPTPLRSEPVEPAPARAA